MKPVVGIIGYGRFGKSLGQLVQRAGGTVRAFDPYQPPPADVRAQSLSELVEGASHVVLAVPFGQLDESLDALLPHLGRTEALVMDACSVKVRPAETLGAKLPPNVAWAATHPLFGPLTLSLDERPFRVVVCPNPEQPASTGRARAFYAWMGCEVLEQSPDAHDRTMAESHLAACFVAEGLLGAGFAVDHPFVTPSFRALVRVVDGVRGEADHLRAAVYQGNPYGAAARKRLLAALEAIDRGLSVAADDSAHPERETERKIAAEQSTQLQLTEARGKIDDLDKQLVALLARRAELAREIVGLKQALGSGVLDAGREENLFRIRRAWSSAQGLDADAVEEIFRSILKFSRGLQHAKLRQTRGTGWEPDDQ